MNFMDIAKYMALATDLLKAINDLIQSNRNHSEVIKENTEAQKQVLAALKKETENA